MEEPYCIYTFEKEGREGGREVVRKEGRKVVREERKENQICKGVYTHYTCTCISTIVMQGLIDYMH